MPTTFYSTRRFLLTLLALCSMATLSVAFTTLPYATTRQQQQQQSVSALQERRWNFNEGQSPWGLKKNAEVWNGRYAQMAFVIVFLQEVIQGKGVIQGIKEGDPVNLAGVGLFVVTAVGLTAWLAIKGDDDYVKRDLERDNIKYP